MIWLGWVGNRIRGVKGGEREDGLKMLSDTRGVTASGKADFILGSPG